MLNVLLSLGALVAHPFDCRSFTDPNQCLQYAPMCQWDDTEPPGEQCELNHNHDYCARWDFNPSGCLSQAPFCKWDQQEQHCEMED